MGACGKSLAFLALGLLAEPVFAQAQSLELSPQSKWVMDYDADSCALRRIFGDPERQVLLELRQYAPGWGFQVTVASSTIDTVNKRPRVRFEPDTVLWEPDSPILGAFGEMEGVVYSDSFWPNSRQSVEGEVALPWPDADRDAREASITGLFVADTFEHNLLIKTGAMHQPMAAMRACIDELMTHWGIDVEAHRSLSRPVTPKDQQSWAQQLQQRYPSEMIRAGRSAYIRIRLIVGTDGKLSSCNVQIEAQHPVFQETACRILMRHARFEPTLDARGSPIASYFTTAIIYRVSG